MAGTVDRRSQLGLVEIDKMNQFLLEYNRRSDFFYKWRSNRYPFQNQVFQILELQILMQARHTLQKGLVPMEIHLALVLINCLFFLYSS